MKLSNLHRLGMFHQKVRSAANLYEKLTALLEYESYMEEIEADAFQDYKEREALRSGKTPA